MRPKILVLTAFFTFLYLASFAYAQTTEEITITTYYPSPYGVYKELRLFPNATPAGCNANTVGAMYYDNSTIPGKPKVCNQVDATTYSWQDLGAAGWYVPQQIASTGAVLHNGNFEGDGSLAGNQGFEKMRRFVRTHCGNDYHVCSGSELTSWAQMGNRLPAGFPASWYLIDSSYRWDGSPGNTVYMCQGWTTNNAQPASGPVVTRLANGGPSFSLATCDTAYPVACCR